MKKIRKVLASMTILGLGLLAYIYFGVFEKKIYLGENKTIYFYIKSTDKLSNVLNNL